MNLPCNSCPWRTDQNASAIPRYNHGKACALTNTVGEDDAFRPIMACHYSPEGKEEACRGYLARAGWSNLNVRLLLARGQIENPSEVLDACEAAGVELEPDYNVVLAKLEATRRSVSNPPVLQKPVMPEPYTYFIAGRISQKGHMLACHKCGRKILVEIGLCGVSHNVGVTVVCAACLTVSAEFTKDHPDIARQLTEWAEVTPIDDDPELDGTDAAHPAWWRGQEYGFDAAMRMIEEVLTERPAGVIGNERWQALRERIHAMANQSRDG